jgi:uncharacterized membrane protein YphA (DoxX/SURF4 family)
MHDQSTTKPMKSKILLVVSFLYGLMMINGGLNKFLEYMPVPELAEPVANLFTCFVESQWIFPLLAIAEIIGGILVIIPKTRALGAIVLFPIVVGIFLHHLTIDPSGLVFGVILFLIEIWILIENRAKYQPMIS